MTAESTELAHLASGGYKLTSMLYCDRISTGILY